MFAFWHSYFWLTRMELSMTSVNNVCDYITLRLAEAEECSNLLKIQKLLYYCQAWNLAIKKKPLFNGKFQAWIHGPVNRDIYDRFRESKSLYSQVTTSDILNDFNPSNIPEQDKLHINSVLEVYANFTGSQLEEMSHNEAPWQLARDGYRNSARCFEEIDESQMHKFYAARLP